MIARATLLADRLDHRGLERLLPRAAGPIPLAQAAGPTAPGHAFAFRWGALVTIGMAADAEAAMIASLASRLHDPLPAPLTETLTITLDPTLDGTDAAGRIHLREISPDRLAILAEALAKSVALSHQETILARTLDRLDPIVAQLRSHGRLGTSSRALLRSIGEALAARNRAAGRVDPTAKSALLWEHPELTSLHVGLAEELELEERAEALARKLAMIHETSETLLSLVEARRSRGLEIAVLLFLAMEAATALYGLFKG